MTGYGVLLRSYLRRDRWQIPLWVVGITVLFWSQAASVDGLYTSQAELDKAAETMGSNAAFVAMAGPARALDTIGGQVFWQASAFGAVVIALMSMFLVGRHTRAEEESGRDELVRSAPVGRFASVTAAATVAGGACLLAGAALAAALASYPLPVADSVATGAGLALTGWVFVGVALVAVQLTTTTRAAYGITGAVIGVAYGLRAIGDIGENGLSWLTPIGWYQALRPYADVRWWPLALLVAGAAALALAAYAVLVRRDAGAGVLPPRPGPARGDLRSGLGLAWRVQRPALLGWTVGLLLAGLAFGSIGDDVGDLVGDSAASRYVFAPGGDLVDGFYATALLMLALLASGFAISSSLRPRGEEDAGRTELLLSTGLSRTHWFAGHAVVTVLGSLVTLAAGGLGVGVGFAPATGEWDQVGRLSVPVLAYLAPTLACAAIAWLLVGALPRAAVAAWAVLGWAAVVLLLGELLSMPAWLRGLSPFDHLAAAPAEPFAALPVAVVGLLAAGLTASAVTAVRHRDLH